jgi:hypothetical protein
LSDLAHEVVGKDAERADVGMDINAHSLPFTQELAIAMDSTASTPGPSQPNALDNTLPPMVAPGPDALVIASVLERWMQSRAGTLAERLQPFVNGMVDSIWQS